jgi:DNA-binding SARP family transcriptional activator
VTTFAVLGSLRVTSDNGEELRLGRTKRRLVMRLLAEGGRPLSAASIADAVWATPRATGTHNLQSHIHQLRIQLGPGRIETVGRSYRLVVSDRELDATIFERAVDAAAQALAGHQPRLAGYFLRNALGLWRGPAWSEVADTAWAYAQAARLNQLRLGAEELLLEARLAAGADSGRWPGPAWPHPAGSARITRLSTASRGQSEGAAGHERAVDGSAAVDRRPVFEVRGLHGQSAAV